MRTVLKEYRVDASYLSICHPCVYFVSSQNIVKWHLTINSCVKRLKNWFDGIDLEIDLENYT